MPLFDMGIRAEIRYQKLNRRQIDEMSKKSVHPWIEIMRLQEQQIKDLKQELQELKQSMEAVTNERDKAVKAYHRRNAETEYWKWRFYNNDAGSML